MAKSGVQTLTFKRVTDRQTDRQTKLETVSIAELLQIPAACAPNAVNTREQGKEGGRVR